MTLPPELFAESISLKQLVFVGMTISFLVVAIPMAIRFKWMDQACMAGLMFMAINPIDVTFFSYTFYRGDIRGIEFGVTDWMLITLSVAMFIAPRWKKRRLHYRNPNELFMGLYLFLAVFSIFTAIIPQFAFFGVTKLLRAYLTFWVAYNFLRSEEDLRFILWCFVGLTFYSFIGVLMDKYVRGVYPPRGSFLHQNDLATFQNIINFTVFSVFLQDTRKPFEKRMLIYWMAIGAGVLTTMATLSRGGIATMVAGFMLITALTFLLRQESIKIKKKFTVLGVIFLLSLPVLAFVLPPVIDRFQNAPVESGESRKGANEASRDMGGDNFFGVGLNNYSFAINYMEYGENLSKLDRGIAHHIFWLHYAELGLIGLLLFVAMTARFKWLLLRFILKRKDGIERVFAIGILVSFIVLWLIGTLEWNFRTTQLSIVYFMLAGFATSLARLEKSRIRVEKNTRQKKLFWYAFMTGRRKAYGNHMLRYLPSAGRG